MKLLCLRVADTKGTLTTKVCLEAQSDGRVEEVGGREKQGLGVLGFTQMLHSLSSHIKFCTELCSDKQEAQI